MKKIKKRIDLSVIVPVYNVEAYLPECIDSLLQQHDICLEIILIDDGSTDQSGTIVDQYAGKDKRIKVIHQQNGGASAARNAGLDIAQGEYIVFIDSDDWVKENSLCKLYHEAIRYQADMVMGSITCHEPNRLSKGLCKPVPKELLYIPFDGKEGFIHLAKAGVYTFMVCICYRSIFLKKIQARFEEGIMYEDELWTPAVLCQAAKLVITDIEFYYYRQNEESVMHTTSLFRRLDSLFRVTDRLIAFADNYDFSGKDRELKSRLYVNIFKLYARTFDLLACVKDTSYTLPDYHLDRFWRDCREMTLEPQKICKRYFHHAEKELKKYTDWVVSGWVASIASQMNAGQKLMLIYNVLPDEDLTLKVEDVPTGWLITTDRRYLQQADAVVFHLPSLYQVCENDLDKQEGQVWISWYLESEKEDSWVENPEIDVFDHWICYRQDESQQEHPLVRLCRKLAGDETDNNNKRIALTVDDLPFVALSADDETKEGMEITSLLLQHLKLHEVHVTAFVNGGTTDREETMLNAVTKWHSDGHLLANHTYSHPALSHISSDDFEKDVIRNEKILAPFLKNDSQKYFRFPYLDYGNSPEQTENAMAFLHRRSYTVVPVTLDSKDYVFNAIYTDALNNNQNMVDKYLEYIQKIVEFREQQAMHFFGRFLGQIMLIHANRINALYLGRVITLLKQQGYEFVSLQEVINEPIYKKGGATINSMQLMSWESQSSDGKPVKISCPNVPREILEAYNK